MIYIPFWSSPIETQFAYLPFNGHVNLFTATAAARYYKYQNGALGEFTTFIVNLIATTGGKHFHYGPLPAEIMARIKKRLEIRGICSDRFVHIEWASNIQESILENKIDIFIAPFPISSIKLNLQCMSSGIPIFAYAGGLTRIDQNDYLHPDLLTWMDKKSFFTMLSNLNDHILKLQ